jgi:tRNA threonylcarbamoyladenosine biosynthesis protein TsaE
VIVGALDEDTMTMRARALGLVIREQLAREGGAGPLDHPQSHPQRGGSPDPHDAAPTAADGPVLLLHGPMGAGKTTFTRALAEGLGVARPDRVCSPTFTLCMVHAGAPGAPTLVHVDLFRLADADDEGMGGGAGFDALMLEEIAGDESELAGISARVLVVEWAAKWSTPPADHLAIRLAIEPPGTRRIVELEARGPRSAEILARWSERIAGDSPLL